MSAPQQSVAFIAEMEFVSVVSVALWEKSSERGRSLTTMIKQLKIVKDAVNAVRVSQFRTARLGVNRQLTVIS